MDVMIGRSYRLRDDPVLGDYRASVVEVKDGPRGSGPTLQYLVSWGDSPYEQDWINADFLNGSEMIMMTLNEFRATGRNTEDLGKELKDETFGGLPGRTYLHDDLYIEREPLDGWPGDIRGEWRLEIFGYGEWMSDDLPRLEAILYEFAVAEGLIK